MAVPVWRYDACGESVGVAEPVHPAVQFQQLRFEIIGREQIPVDRVRRLRGIETRRPRFCLGRQVIVFGAERVSHGFFAHIPMVAAFDGAGRCGAAKAAPSRPELRSVRSTS